MTNPHPAHTPDWHLREAQDWAETAESLYLAAGKDEEPGDIPVTLQQVQAAAAIGQLHAALAAGVAALTPHGLAAISPEFK